jgi:hypothetical protein
VYDTELDDSILKRTDPRVNAHLYQLLNVFYKISKKFNIRYWANMTFQSLRWTPSSSAPYSEILLAIQNDRPFYPRTKFLLTS